MGISTMFLFKKSRKAMSKENKPIIIDDYFLKFPASNVCMSANLTNDVKKELTKTGLEFPYEIKLEYDKENPDGVRDYFMTNETWKNELGETQVKDVCVIQSFRDVKHYNIVGEDLQDVFTRLTKSE